MHHCSNPGFFPKFIETLKYNVWMLQNKRACVIWPPFEVSVVAYK
jgi:hypothetical protein